MSLQTETADKLKELELELENCLNEIEEAVISGNYEKAFKFLQKAKARTYIIKVQNKSSKTME